jgi:CopA family copper-resistance protein
MSIIDHRGPLVGRRRILLGLAAASAVGPFEATLRAARAADVQAALSGTEFNLTIGEMPFGADASHAIATAVNNSVPAPLLRWRQGDTITLNVTNRLKVTTSIHWHGVRTPTGMDGVPGLSFPGIAPGETFTYRFPVHQHGTYWYHGHSGFQEQMGLYGPIIIEPRNGYADRFNRDYVVMLSDWPSTDPETILSNLKFQSDYYNYGQRTLGTFVADVGRDGLGATLKERGAWGRMRMSPTDIADVSGAVYTYLLNGQVPGADWTALFKPGERVRLRFINAAAMTFFDVRIPGLKLSVIQADGNDVEPIAVDEFRMGPAETYDVIVEPGDGAYTIFAQAEDRSGFARGTLAPRPGMAAAVPAVDPRPILTVKDMGMGMGDMTGMDMSGGKRRGSMDMPGMKDGDGAMPGMDMGPKRDMTPKVETGISVDNVAVKPMERLDDPGNGLGANGRRVLRYTDLRAREAGADPRPAMREITLHLTGNMQRYMWGIDGKKLSEAPPVPIKYGERVRVTLVNDTMMEHPMHLHGLWSELDNGQGEYRPYKHTIIVKPGETLSFFVTADEPGLWAFHCHLMFHMDLGMFRVVEVA